MTTPRVIFSVPAGAPRRDRGHVLLRLLVLGVLAIFHLPLMAVYGALYLALPVFAAVMVSRSPDGYFERVGPKVTAGFRWLIGLSAYLAFLTDRPPDAGGPGVTLEIDAHGAPTVRSALLRFLISLPDAIVLFVLACLGGLVWIVQALSVIAVAEAPGWTLAYQRRLLERTADLLAFHASLVDEHRVTRTSAWSV
jgi:hypothetical protein